MKNGLTKETGVEMTGEKRTRSMKAILKGFQPRFLHFAIALPLAMFITYMIGLIWMPVLTPLDVIFAAMFPFGLTCFTFPFISSSMSMNVEDCGGYVYYGWMLYFLIILLGMFQGRVRKAIFLVFVLLLLVNIGGCACLLHGLANIANV